MLSPAHQELLKTLSNAKRFEIMLHLIKTPLTVSELIEKTGLEQTAVSHHLHRLRKCNFVRVEENGRERIYSVNDRTAGKFFVLLDEHAQKHCKNLCVTSSPSKHG